MLEPVDLPPLKVIVVGDKGVGKTRLISALVDDRFEDDVNARIRTIARDMVSYEMETVEYGAVTLQIWDTVGEEYGDAVTSNLFRGAHGIIILYDVTNPKSFHNISNRWLPRIKSVMGNGGMGDEYLNSEMSTFRVFIVANKIDAERERVVTPVQCKGLADMYSLPYIQLSALHSEKEFIILPFLLLTRQMVPTVLSRKRGATTAALITIKDRSDSESTCC
jgi:small GTP-binding protein